MRRATTRSPRAWSSTPRAASVHGLLSKRLVRIAIAGVAVVAAGISAPSSRAANSIVTENQRSGDLTWSAALRADNNFVHPPIQGYAGATSVRPGQAIDFHVSLLQPGRYRLEIVRLGWYG